MITVCGIDPSLTSTGIAVRHDTGRIELHRVQSKGSKTDTWQMRHDRIMRLVTSIVALVPNGAHVAMEGPAYAANTGSAHDRAGLWWALYHALADFRHASILVVEPTRRCKYATGKGNAGKDAVLAAVVKAWPDLDVSGNDVADALAFLTIGARVLGEPIDDVTAGVKLAAIKGLRFPGQDLNGALWPADALRGQSPTDGPIRPSTGRAAAQETGATA